MTQIKSDNVKARQYPLSRRIADAVKWWAEHQAWPATDEIRIERRRSTCG